ncbi:TetR/AcrR family transcriptional regulator [Pseudomonas gingeri]|uniref:TetR/AcrR family transcriptional regulator n=1 Tax=Pseudomonas gingeri TaxID=117681 RepID=UPI0015A00C5F|nr:TetR/AcrR family transcriptional regulator [Pseudomonas gingeri]NWA04864.1 TetR/AcrR family transcriptional regulator [Pseudomonas gingeri]NWA17745.1 TetR/AcrR family transcriptional regulator [Pseudomonas gingeri]NWA56847.1 TetR/AcrR family transcriptional regulator [Pseudomonas gingeri]NWA97287.1 TetR/AcrR family transcriptional regulator [Pseudomonas gingeri]NWB01661.1 TetR/AcrR family transcriptional regulator [Pseudomonas gingeri]
MARTRAFNREQALQQAIRVFCDKGFSAASTDELMQAMQLGRQSVYNTFGDKRALYMHAMRQYTADSVCDLILKLGKGASPLAGLELALLAFVSRVQSQETAGCMGVNAVCEFGVEDAEINQLRDTAAQTLMAAFERTLNEARDAGEIDREIDIAAAARYLMSSLGGLKLSAKAGASIQILQETARFALRSLR